MVWFNSSAISCDERLRCQWFGSNAVCRTLCNSYAPQIINGFRLLFALLILFMIVINANAMHASGDVRSIEDALEGRNVATNGVAYNISPQNNETDTNVENNDEENPSEIQKAVCTVTAGEVKASAEAVTTKTLKGVCGSYEMHVALEKLEIKLLEELKEIKLLLQQINHIPKVERETMKQSGQQSTTVTTEKTVEQNIIKLQPMADKFKSSVSNAYLDTNKNSTANSIMHNDFYVRQSGVMPKLKSLPRQLHSSVREQEVSKFNNTMLADRDLKVFTYYWKMENFSEHIRSDESNTVESPIFSIKGKPLHIKAFFNHLHRDFLYLQLEYATLNTNSNRNRIILDTGGLFKEILNDKVLFRHKISILDQNNQRSKDLVSQEFNNLEMGFSIPNSALLSSPYVKKNSLLIQVFLYL